MYPFIKTALTLFKAKYRAPLKLADESVLHQRVGITDFDLFGELNNARYLNHMELGRWDYSQRTGFYTLMKRKKWGVAVGGASIRYRRRLPFLSKFTVTSKIICHDGRWMYFLQEFHRDTQSDKQICASALMKVCVTSKDGLVPAPEVLEALGGEEGSFSEMPEWVSAWIEAESLRPWELNS